LISNDGRSSAAYSLLRGNFMTITIILMQIVVSSNDPVYQIALCVPAITAFTLAASVALRRIRYTKAGFFVQFIGPVLFALPLISELDFI
jgi:hypothetical protein